MSLAVLIGAGATHGTGDIQPGQAPLGRELYEALAQAFPNTWGQLPPDEDRAFRRWFESGMELLWKKWTGPDGDVRAQKLLIQMAVYFSRFRPPFDASDCYSELLRAIRNVHLEERTLFGSLNYECVFEAVPELVGLALDYSPVPRAGAVAVVKPHGSCNLIVAPGAGSFTDVWISGRSNLIQGPVRPMPLDQIEPYYAAGNSIPPAMSLYSPGKPSPVFPGVIEGLREDWAQWVTAVSLVVVIGANPYLEDEHVWRPIIDSRADVWYIGGKGDGFADFQGELQERLTVLGHDFDEALPRLIYHLTLLP